MVKALLAVVVAVLIAAVIGFFFFGHVDGSALTPCERDCINDSGGQAWCADYCKKYGSYGPAKK
jgi:hypothetical protein